MIKRLPFLYRLLLAFSLVVLVATAVSAIVSFYDSTERAESALARELLAIVNTLSAALPVEMHELVRLAPDGSIDHPEEFELIRTLLLHAKANNHLPALRGSPIYTLRPAADFDTTRELEFVVMTNRNAQNKFFTGYRYPAEAHNLKALEGEAATSGLYTDAEGTWISACAPLRDSRGIVVALVQADRPADFFAEKMRQIAASLLLSSLISVGIAIGIAFLVARSFSKPIARLVDAHTRFGAGDCEVCDVRLPDDRPDELGRLMRSFNQMADSITRSRAELQEYNRTLETRVEQRTHELQEKNEELVALNNEKNEFMGIAAHDLKNPLSGIMGYAEMLAEMPDADPKERHDWARTIQKQAERMLQLITNLLDVNAIERGQLRLSLGPTDPAAILNSVVSDYRKRAADKHLELIESYPKPPLLASLDPDVFVQIADNLVSNAIKYSPTHKRIFISVEAHDADRLRVSVRDEGPGISAEDRKRLFGKFARLTARPTAGESSTGLGLSIVKRMVESMQGKVWCESELGCGATFIVEFPRLPGDGARH